MADPALVQVPVRHVDAGVAQDRVVEARRHEVEPALVGVHPAAIAEEAVAAHAIRPPVEERPASGTHRNEPGTVEPCHPEVGFARAEAVDREWLQEARREHDASLLGERDNDGQLGVQVDVGVHEDHDVGAVLEEVAQKVRLERGRELRCVIDGAHPRELPVGQAQDTGREHLQAIRLGDIAVLGVDHEHVEGQAAVMPPPGVRKDGRVGQVITRDDRAPDRHTRAPQSPYWAPPTPRHRCRRRSVIGATL